MSKKIYPGIAARLEFIVEDADGLPVPSLTHSDTSSAGYRDCTDGVVSSTTSVSLTSSVAATASVNAGQFVTINSSRGHYAIDVPSGAAGASLDYAEAVVVFSAGHTVTPIQHEIDLALQTISAAYVKVAVDIPDAISGVASQATDIQDRIPAALIGGRMDSYTGAMAANVITAAALATDAGQELAAMVETYIVNEGDATAVMQAIADKIAADWVAGDASPLAIVAAIKADASLSTMISRIDAAISSRSTYAGGDTSGTTTLLSRVVGTIASGTHNPQSGDAFARLGAPSGASVSADVASVKSDTNTLLSRVTTTVATLWANLTAMITGSGASAKFTTTALENAPAGGGGGSGDASQATLLAVKNVTDQFVFTEPGRVDATAVLDSADLAEIKGDGWDSSTDTLEKIRDAISIVSSISVVIPSPVEEIIGMPETLEIGDSYDGDTSIKLYVRDGNDDPVTSFAGHDFTDGDFAPTFTIAPTPGSARGRVVGTVTWVPASGPDEGYLKVEIPSSQSRRAVEGESSVQCVLKWDGYEKSILTTTVRWLPRI